MDIKGFPKDRAEQSRSGTERTDFSILLICVLCGRNRLPIKAFAAVFICSYHTIPLTCGGREKRAACSTSVFPSARLVTHGNEASEPLRSPVGPDSTRPEPRSPSQTVGLESARAKWKQVCFGIALLCLSPTQGSDGLFRHTAAFWAGIR